MEPEISISYTFLNGQSVGEILNDAHFGTNLLFHQDDTQGDFADVISALGTKVLRWPGGTLAERYFNLVNPDATSVASFIPGESKTISIETTLSEFLSYCGDNSIEQVIVIPFYRYFDGTGLSTQGAGEITAFVKKLLEGQYGDVDIRGFETGNEWFQDTFGWSVAEFAAVQAEVVAAIEAGIGEAGIPAGEGPDIFVQTGRNNSENESIYDALTGAGVWGDVDGVLSHFYVGNSNGNVMSVGGGINSRLNDIENVFKLNDPTPRQLLVSEWNVSDDDSGNTPISGMERNAGLFRAFAEMTRHGVDVATIWTAQRGSNSTLSSPEGDGSDLRPTGMLYRMLSRALPGTQIVDPQENGFYLTDGTTNIGYRYVFQDGDRTIIYLVSGVSNTINLDADLSVFLQAGTHMHATRLEALGAIPEAEDVETRQMAERGQIWTDLGGGTYQFELEAYEVLQIELTTGKGVSLWATIRTR